MVALIVRDESDPRIILQHQIRPHYTGGIEVTDESQGA